jgi:hypothetical protein
MGIKVANNAFATLAAGISNSATSITVASGQGARFPILGAGDYFYATLINTSNQLEIVKCTARSADVLTVERAQEGTTARAYDVGDRIEIRITAATFEDATDKANALVTPRTLTIGNTGKDFDGSADVVWTRDEIGVPHVEYLGAFDLIGTGNQTAYVLICRRDTEALFRKFDGKIFGARRSGNTAAISVDLLVSDSSGTQNISYALNTTTIQLAAVTRMVSLTHNGQAWLALEIVTTETTNFSATGFWASWTYRTDGISLQVVRPSQVSGVAAYNSFQRANLQAGFGWNQSWVDLTATRLAATTYTNTTGQAIEVAIAVSQSNSTSGGSYDFLVDDVTLFTGSTGSQTWRDGFSAVVPQGSTYRLNRTGGGIISSWSELR